MEIREKKKAVKEYNIVINRINKFFEKGIGGIIGKTVAILSAIVSVVLAIKEISLIFFHQDSQQIASYYKISENIPNKGFIIMYYIFICIWGYFVYRNNKGHKKITKIFCSVVLTIIFTITSYSVLFRNITFEINSKWLFTLLNKTYLWIFFIMFINYLISLIVLFFDLTKRAKDENKNKKIERGIFSLSLIISVIILFFSLFYLLSFGIENKRGYEIFEQDGKLKTILYEKNGKYIVADCRIENNDIIPSMETLIIDTTTFKETELCDIERRFKIFRKIERINRNIFPKRRTSKEYENFNIIENTNLLKTTFFMEVIIQEKANSKID